MLFTAPAFLFAFLPFSVIFCVIFGKTRKRLCLALVCVIYHILLNIYSPLNMIWIPLITAFAYFFARAVKGRNKFIGIAVGTLPIVWLIVMRCLEYYATVELVYPVGMTLPALSAAAYVWDVAYGGEAERNIGRLGLYFAFFPIMLVGPFIGYSEFLSLTDTDRMQISLSRCSSGIGSLALGFIKRIAVGAVLIDGYEKIFAYSWDAPNLAIIFLLVVIIYFGVYFSMSGYYDMAIGISRIYGIDVPLIRSNPFTVATANEYSIALFNSVHVWAERYILKPIGSSVGKAPSRFMRICTVSVCTLAFIRSDLTVFVLALPLIAFATASAKLGLDDSSKGKRQGLRVLFGFLMMLVIGALWVFVTSSGRDPIDISSITFENAEYQTDVVMMSFSGIKYLFVVTVGLFTLIPNSQVFSRVYDKLGVRARAVADYTGMLILLLMFLFTVMFFLPQFETYATRPFMYVVI